MAGKLRRSSDPGRDGTERERKKYIDLARAKSEAPVNKFIM